MGDGTSGRVCARGPPEPGWVGLGDAGALPPIFTARCAPATSVDFELRPPSSQCSGGTITTNTSAERLEGEGSFPRDQAEDTGRRAEGRSRCVRSAFCDLLEHSASKRVSLWGRGGRSPLTPEQASLNLRDTGSPA